MQKDNSPQVSLNNSINETRQQKQLYLRQQIIQAGYDPEQFISYLNVKLDIHSDLDNCSIKHLEEVVQDFKNKKNRDKQQINSYFFRETAVVQPPICQKSSSVLEPQRILIRPYPQVIQDEYFNKYKCVKVIDKYQKLKGQITCQVKNPQRKYMGGLLGIGGSSFLCFDVSPVCRRYSDFIWLRNVLTKFCPSFIIPPVPNKKSSKRLPRQIRKRMQILAFFLNDIVKMPTLLNNKYVQGFLLIKDQNKFQSLKQQGEKKKSYQSILSTQTLSGSVQLDLSSQTVKYKQGLNKFVPEVQKLYKQITRNSKKLNSLTVQKINLLYQMSNQFAQLYDISNKFNGFVKSQSTQRLNQIYAMLNNMMAEWGNSLRQEIEYVQKNISTFFKYVRQSFMGFKQLMQKTTNSEQIWIKERQLLEKQKQKIFQLKDTKKWDLNKVQLKNLPKSALYDRNQAFKIMLPKQSVRVNNLKQNYAYYLNQLFEHGNQNLFNSADNFCDNFKQFSIKTKVNNQEIGSMWSQVSYKFSDPYKKSAVILKMQMEKLDESLGQLNGTFQD